MENNLQVMNFIRPTRFLSTALKVWLGFLLLIVKCKREEIKETLAKTNQEDLIWKILSLSQLQKTLKLGSSLSENYERKPMVCQDKLLLEPWKDQKVRIFSHTESPLKKLSIWLSFSRQLRCLDLLCSFGLLLWAIVPMTIYFSKSLQCCSGWLRSYGSTGSPVPSLLVLPGLPRDVGGKFRKRWPVLAATAVIWTCSCGAGALLMLQQSTHTKKKCVMMAPLTLQWIWPTAVPGVES